mmetsp:Transcript_32084/g.81420  ORF Transcript_32084/g.81420 Transcript_32084/m.81420 type:complete len:242 (+) Transcript_32084:543-1268(+)
MFAGQSCAFCNFVDASSIVLMGKCVMLKPHSSPKFNLGAMKPDQLPCNFSAKKPQVPSPPKPCSESHQESRTRLPAFAAQATGAAPAAAAARLWKIGATKPRPRSSSGRSCHALTLICMSTAMKPSLQAKPPKPCMARAGNSATLQSWAMGCSICPRTKEPPPKEAMALGKTVVLTTQTTETISCKIGARTARWSMTSLGDANLCTREAILTITVTKPVTTIRANTNGFTAQNNTHGMYRT